MLNINGENLPEVIEIFKEIIESPEKIFDMLRIDLRGTCEMAISELIKTEHTNFPGREKIRVQE